jgi:hypothetical protein
MRRTLSAILLALTAIPAAHAQTVITRRPLAQGFAYSSSDDKDRAMLGISTSPSGKRDTLGVLVTSVTANGPAEKAGLEEGNRLMAINGVSLKLSREDASDDDMQGVTQNRLTREMRKVKPGEDVTLEVWGGGRARTVKVKTVSAEELSPTRRVTVTRDEERAAIGIVLAPTGNKRDTAGVFVQQVVDGGPADKAGIAEGDRISSINGVDVRVPREDAGDWSIESSRIDRAERELRKLKPGQAADIVVYGGGRSRTLKVTTVKASDLPATSGFSFRTGPEGGMRMFGPGAGGIMMGPGTIKVAPRVRINRGMDDFDHFDGFNGFDGYSGFDKDAFKAQIEESMKGLKDLGPKIRMELDNSLPRAMDELRAKLNENGPATVKLRPSGRVIL